MVMAGDTLYFEIKIINLKRAILRPFSSIKWLMAYYIVIFFTSMVVFAVGSSILSAASLCVTTTPRMYSYVSFIVGVYWLMFDVIVFFTIKQAFGANIAKAIVSATTAPSQSELEERIFRKKFAEFDLEKSGSIPNTDFPAFVQALGAYIPDDEIPALILTLDPEKTGSVNFDPALEWFLKMSGDNEDADMQGGDDAMDDFMNRD